MCLCYFCTKVLALKDFLKDTASYKLRVLRVAHSTGDRSYLVLSAKLGLCFEQKSKMNNRNLKAILDRASGDRPNYRFCFKTKYNTSYCLELESKAFIIQVMTNIKEELTRKLDNLSVEQLKSVKQYIDSLEVQHHSIHPEPPITNEDIDRIVELYRQQNKKRPIGLAKGEFTVPDDFNEPLPDEILDLFNDPQ